MKHHSLLHITKSNPPQQPSDESGGNDCVATTVESRAGPPLTAVMAVSSGSHKRYARALLDTGAEVSLISRAFANSLDSQPLRKPPMTIGGMGSVISPYAIQLVLHGEESMEFENETLHLEARVVDSIPQPTSAIGLQQIKDLPFLNGQQLADPAYKPHETVDIILDNRSYHLCRTGKTLVGP